LKVPVFNLSRAAETVREEIESSWSRLLGQTAFIGGEEVARFEGRFAEYLGSAGCVGVANGTDALIVALRALDLKPGDEVIVPAFTFIASGASIQLAGGTPVFADVDPATLNLDPESARSKVSDRTVGIIGVHLYGRPFDVEAIGAICEENDLWLLEDSAQAHGAEWRGKRVGNFGRLATWSFYPSKNLGAFGDGGAVTGNDTELLDRVRRIANHGRVDHYLHSEVGVNSRLDGLQAAVLNARLERLDAGNARRREIAARYRETVEGIEGVRFLDDGEHVVCVYHQATLVTDRQEALRAALSERGVGSSVHYPVALHDQPAFAAARDGELPVSTGAAGQVVCLPMFPELTDEEVDVVCEAVRSFFAGG